MTNLQKWTSKDVNAIFDAANRYSVGLDDLFYRLHSYGVGSPGGAYPPGRSFTRGFNLSDDVEIGEVAFNNGLLTIELKKVIPEHQKLKSYTIS